MIKKLMFNVADEKIGVAGFHFGIHDHTIDLFDAQRHNSQKQPTKKVVRLFGGPTSTKKKFCGHFLTPLLMLKSIKIQSALTS